MASVGFPAGAVPEPELIEAAMGERASFLLPGGENAQVIPTRLDDPDAGRIVLARSSSEAVGPDEVILLNGMIRVLGMTLTTIRTVESLRQRQRLLEQNAAIERAIAVRAPLQDVLDLIVQSVSEFLAVTVVAMRMVETANEGRMRVVASVGFEPDLLRRIDQTPLDQGIAGQSVAEDRIVVAENYPGHAVARPELVRMGIRSAMATPIHDRGTPIGTLVVGSSVPGRVFTPAEQETLVAFAQHATLALMDARTVDELVRQALHDPLTTLANRALFLDRLAHALARAERVQESVGVLFLDLDRFKGVNDGLGHAAGDALLIEVGRRLEALVRSTDTVARFGGDEFALLLEDVDDRASVDLLAGSVVDLLRKPFNLGRDEVSITASIGVALARHGADDPLRDADLALYRAKSDGKNRHEFFVDEMRTAMRARLKLEAELQRAVSGDEFVLHYQPIVDLRFGSILGMEALIRWNQDGRGLLPPDDFIRLAEDTGAILAIGRWVLREACSGPAASLPPEAGGRPPFVSVNISPIQLIQIDLARDVADILAESGLEPSRLVLEITETSLLDDTVALRKLRALKKLGVRLAVDDFGTGYSSLAYLRQFPVDVLKIAKPFIDELADSARGTLAQAIIELGRTFKLEVIAEGIDRREHVTRLRKLGCTTGQGFLLSRPLDPQAASALMRHGRVSLPTSDPVAARERRRPVSVGVPSRARR